MYEMTFQKKQQLFFTCLPIYIYLASGALIVIADNKRKLMDLCYRCYKFSFYHIFPYAYNTKMYRGKIENNSFTFE